MNSIIRNISLFKIPSYISKKSPPSLSVINNLVKFPIDNKNKNKLIQTYYRLGYTKDVDILCSNYILKFRKGYSPGLATHQTLLPSLSKLTYKTHLRFRRNFSQKSLKKNGKEVKKLRQPDQDKKIHKDHISSNDCINAVCKKPKKKRRNVQKLRWDENLVKNTDINGVFYEKIKDPPNDIKFTVKLNKLIEKEYKEKETMAAHGRNKINSFFFKPISCRYCDKKNKKNLGSYYKEQKRSKCSFSGVKTMFPKYAIKKNKYKNKNYNELSAPKKRQEIYPYCVDKTKEERSKSNSNVFYVTDTNLMIPKKKNTVPLYIVIKETSEKAMCRPHISETPFGLKKYFYALKSLSEVQIPKLVNREKSRIINSDTNLLKLWPASDFTNARKGGFNYVLSSKLTEKNCFEDKVLHMTRQHSKTESSVYPSQANITENKFTKIKPKKTTSKNTKHETFLAESTKKKNKSPVFYYYYYKDQAKVDGASKDELAKSIGQMLMPVLQQEFLKYSTLKASIDRLEKNLMKYLRHNDAVPHPQYSKSEEEKVKQNKVPTVNSRLPGVASPKFDTPYKYKTVSSYSKNEVSEPINYSELLMKSNTKEEDKKKKPLSRSDYGKQDPCNKPKPKPCGFVEEEEDDPCTKKVFDIKRKSRYEESKNDPCIKKKHPPCKKEPCDDCPKPPPKKGPCDKKDPCNWYSSSINSLSEIFFLNRKKKPLKEKLSHSSPQKIVNTNDRSQIKTKSETCRSDSLNECCSIDKLSWYGVKDISENVREKAENSLCHVYKNECNENKKEKHRKQIMIPIKTGTLVTTKDEVNKGDKHNLFTQPPGMNVSHEKRDENCCCQYNYDIYKNNEPFLTCNYSEKKCKGISHDSAKNITSTYKQENKTQDHKNYFMEDSRDSYTNVFLTLASEKSLNRRSLVLETKKSEKDLIKPKTRYEKSLEDPCIKEENQTCKNKVFNECPSKVKQESWWHKMKEEKSNPEENKKATSDYMDSLHQQTKELAKLSAKNDSDTMERLEENLWICDQAHALQTRNNSNHEDKKDKESKDCLVKSKFDPPYNHKTVDSTNYSVLLEKSDRKKDPIKEDAPCQPCLRNDPPFNTEYIPKSHTCDKKNPCNWYTSSINSISDILFLNRKEPSKQQESNATSCNTKVTDHSPPIEKKSMPCNSSLLDQPSLNQFTDTKKEEKDKSKKQELFTHFGIKAEHKGDSHENDEHPETSKTCWPERRCKEVSRESVTDLVFTNRQNKTEDQRTNSYIAEDSRDFFCNEFLTLATDVYVDKNSVTSKLIMKDKEGGHKKPKTRYEQSKEDPCQKKKEPECKKEVWNECPRQHQESWWDKVNDDRCKDKKPCKDKKKEASSTYSNEVNNLFNNMNTPELKLTEEAEEWAITSEPIASVKKESGIKYEDTERARKDKLEKGDFFDFCVGKFRYEKANWEPYKRQNSSSWENEPFKNIPRNRTVTSQRTKPSEYLKAENMGNPYKRSDLASNKSLKKSESLCKPQSSHKVSPCKEDSCDLCQESSQVSKLCEFLGKTDTKGNPYKRSDLARNEPFKHHNQESCKKQQPSQTEIPCQKKGLRKKDDCDPCQVTTQEAKPCEFYKSADTKSNPYKKLDVSNDEPFKKKVPPPKPAVPSSTTIRTEKSNNSRPCCEQVSVCAEPTLPIIDTKSSPKRAKTHCISDNNEAVNQTKAKDQTLEPLRQVAAKKEASEPSKKPNVNQERATAKQKALPVQAPQTPKEELSKKTCPEPTVQDLRYCPSIRPTEKIVEKATRCMRPVPCHMHKPPPPPPQPIEAKQSLKKDWIPVKIGSKKRMRHADSEPGLSRKPPCTGTDPKYMSTMLMAEPESKSLIYICKGLMDSLGKLLYSKKMNSTSKKTVALVAPTKSMPIFQSDKLLCGHQEANIPIKYLFAKTNKSFRNRYPWNPPGEKRQIPKYKSDMVEDEDSTRNASAVSFHENMKKRFPRKTPEARKINPELRKRYKMDSKLEDKQDNIPYRKTDTQKYLKQNEEPLTKYMYSYNSTKSPKIFDYYLEEAGSQCITGGIYQGNKNVNRDLPFILQEVNRFTMNDKETQEEKNTLERKIGQEEKTALARKCSAFCFKLADHGEMCRKGSSKHKRTKRRRQYSTDAFAKFRTDYKIYSLHQVTPNTSARNGTKTFRNKYPWTSIDEGKQNGISKKDKNKYNENFITFSSKSAFDTEIEHIQTTIRKHKYLLELPKTETKGETFVKGILKDTVNPYLWNTVRSNYTCLQTMYVNELTKSESTSTTHNNLPDRSALSEPELESTSVYEGVADFPVSFEVIPTKNSNPTPSNATQSLDCLVNLCQKLPTHTKAKPDRILRCQLPNDKKTRPWHKHTPNATGNEPQTVECDQVQLKSNQNDQNLDYRRHANFLQFEVEKRKTNENVFPGENEKCDTDQSHVKQCVTLESNLFPISHVVDVKSEKELSKCYDGDYWICKVNKPSKYQKLIFVPMRQPEQVSEKAEEIKESCQPQPDGISKDTIIKDTYKKGSLICKETPLLSDKDNHLHMDRQFNNQKEVVKLTNEQPDQKETICNSEEVREVRGSGFPKSTYPECLFEKKEDHISRNTKER